MAKKVLIFVCTGNICRSPMAACLMQAALRRKSGWEVRSAGLAASTGMPASREAQTVMKSHNLSLAKHRSHPLTRDWVDAATALVVMTRCHRDHVVRLFPEATDRTFMLRSFDPAARDTDIADPIGSSVKIYRKTCREIEAALPGLVAHLKTY